MWLTVRIWNSNILDLLYIQKRVSFNAGLYPLNFNLKVIQVWKQSYQKRDQNMILQESWGKFFGFLVFFFLWIGVLVLVTTESMGKKGQDEPVHLFTWSSFKYFRKTWFHWVWILLPPRSYTVAQLVKNLPAMQETPVLFLG